MPKFLKRTFMNDYDGFSAKDFLMVLFGGLYALFLVLAFFAPFFGISVAAGAMSVIGNMSGVIMTIVGGVFAVQSVREFRSNRDNDTYQETTILEEASNVNGTEGKHDI